MSPDIRVLVLNGSKEHEASLLKINLRFAIDVDVKKILLTAQISYYTQHVRLVFAATISYEQHDGYVFWISI